MLRLARLCKFRCSRYFSNSAGPDDFGSYSVILPQEPFVFGTSHIRPRSVPHHIRRPSYSKSDEGRISLGTHEEIKLREAGRLAKSVREFAKSLVEVGTTTNSIDSAIHDFIIQHSAYPAPLHYRGFPRSCCTSVNNIIAHGIPDDRKLEDGDIINIDITVYINGYHGDTSQTFLVGEVDEPGKELVIITNLAVEHGISACGPGKPFNGIGKAIYDVISRKDYSVSSMFAGHGIGRVFHSPPYILHHPNEEPEVMVPGDCFTIEVWRSFRADTPLISPLLPALCRPRKRSSRLDLPGRLDRINRELCPFCLCGTHDPNHGRRSRHSHSLKNPNVNNHTNISVKDEENTMLRMV